MLHKLGKRKWGLGRQNCNVEKEGENEKYCKGKEYEHGCEKDMKGINKSPYTDVWK